MCRYRTVHGEQVFIYHRPACAGDLLGVASRIADIYDKRNGALEFMVIDTAVSRDGVAVAVLCSPAFAEEHGLNRSVRVRAQAMTTDRPGALTGDDVREVVGYSMTREAVQQVYEEAGISPTDVDVVELHDCFAQNELITYEGLGLCLEGGAEKFGCDGDNTYGGKFVTNPPEGLLWKGHPLGAIGLAQCTELVEQLRGKAGKRQVADARLALQHNLSLGGACVVTLYERD